MIRTLALSTFMAVVLWGCQAPPDIKNLQDKNNSLQQQLGQANQKINQLEADRALLKQDVAELNRVVGVLGEEKSSRVTESTNLRADVRKFVQNNIDNLKQFLLASNLLDYIGGELVERSTVEPAPTLVLDLFNSVPRDGSLTGVGGFFQAAGKVSVKVVRPIGDNLVVVWSSQAVDISGRGIHRVNFPVSVGVEKGDYLAYYFAQPGMISYDTGTGNSLYQATDISVGTIISRSSMQGASDKRAYAIGVLGLLN